jgi:5-methylcytosine-specific restriction endonuclease McrA
MIRLTKQLAPQAVRQRLADRADQYAQLTAQGLEIPDAVANGYNHPEIKALLKQETSDKCAYCESKVPHVDHGDIEHILSKRHRQDLRFSFDNLTYSCAVCNNKKHDYHDEQLPLLNPYQDVPEEHLAPFGPIVMRRHNSDRGLITQRRLDLNRGDLVERRQERLEQVAILMDQLVRTTKTAIRDVLEEQIRQECEMDKEYSFVVKGYVNQARGSLAPGQPLA